MGISDANPYIVTMPPVQGDYLAKFMRLSGLTKNEGQGISRKKERVSTNSEEDNDNTKVSLKDLDTSLKSLEKRLKNEMHLIANNEIDERMKIKPKNGEGYTTVPSRSDRQDATDALQRFRHDQARRRDAVEVEAYRIHKRPIEDHRHKIRHSDPPPPAYPGLDDLPWENPS